MRMLIVGVTLGALLTGAAVVAAQDPKPAKDTAAQDTKAAPSTFTGAKLVDTKTRGPEQNVTVTLGKEHVRVIDPAAKKDLKVFAYPGLTGTHTFGKTPPGGVAAPSTTERHWLTLKSGDDEVTLRVSEHVLTQMKAGLESHGVKVEDTK